MDDGSKAFVDSVYSGIPSIDMRGVAGCVPCSMGATAEPINEPEPGGRALGVAVFVGMGLLAAAFLWIGTRGD